MNIFIKTYGCQANIADSEQMAGLLKANNHTLVANESDADAIIVNSCSVKNATQSKILNYLNTHLKNEKPKKIIIGGCLTKTLNLRKKIPDLSAVFDTNSILKINDIVENPHDVFSGKKEERINVPALRKKNGIAIIQTSQGCLNTCAFCATKLARGMLQSYRIGDIKRELEIAVRQGRAAIYITSQDNGCYGFDINTSLPELLNELVTVEGDYKIRVGMMNPWHLRRIAEPLLEAYRSEKIMKFLHIPVQSGSEKVLRDMKRIHTVESFREAVKKFRSEFPGITVATDVIVGYPTETEEDFQETCSLIKEIRPEVLNISTFSSRPGTKAATLMQLSSQIIKERSRRITNLYKRYKQEAPIIQIRLSPEPFCSKHF